MFDDGNTPQSVERFTPANTINASAHRRDRGFKRQWTLVDLNTGRELVIVRTYEAASTAYACAWVHRAGEHASGSSKAGGYGYHKESAAIYAALCGCGFHFAKCFEGMGDLATVEALEAIARHFGLRSRFLVLEAHP